MTGLSARIRVHRAHFTVDVELDVAAGETVAIMGPSGAGKSTLLSALAGLVPLDEGEVRAQDRILERTAAPRVRLAPMQRGIVLLGQEPRLFPHLSARENVAFGPRAGGTPRARARAEADQWLARVGLPGAGARRPADLSGGEQQRVAVARALAASPRAVLLDEPLVALDAGTASEIRAMLREQLAGTTTIAVTHDASDAVALAQRLVVVETGRVSQQGPVRDVLAQPATRFVAAVAGLNRVDGRAVAGAWERDGVRLASAHALEAPVRDGDPLAAVFDPAHVRVRTPREDDARAHTNTWHARIDRVEPTLAGVRVRAGWCDADARAEHAASLVPGALVELHVPPGAVRLVPASPVAATVGA